MIHVLQRAHVAEQPGTRSADDDHRYGSALRVRDGRHHVGDAGTRRDAAHPRLAGDAGPAVGRVPGGLLVPDVDDADSLVEATIVDRLDVPSAQGEEMRRAVPLERLGDQAPSVDHCHEASLEFPEFREFRQLRELLDVPRDLP